MHEFRHLNCLVKFTTSVAPVHSCEQPTQALVPIRIASFRACVRDGPSLLCAFIDAVCVSALGTCIYV